MGLGKGRGPFVKTEYKRALSPTQPDPPVLLKQGLGWGGVGVGCRHLSSASRNVNSIRAGRQWINAIPAHRQTESGPEGAFRGLGWGHGGGMRGGRVRDRVAFSPEVWEGDWPLPRGPHRTIPRMGLTSPSLFPLTFFSL